MKKLLKLTLLLLAISALNLMPGANAQSLITGHENLSTDGTVYAIVTDETRIVLGGDFTRIGERTPYGAITDGTTADVVSGNPVPDGNVTVCKSDGSGGFYLAGSFTEIGGVARAGLAHINSAGAVTTWNPDPNSTVKAIAVLGSTVYVGGSFTSIGGASRNRLAAIDASGNATSWNPDANSTVDVLEASGTSVYVSGAFITSVGGQSRSKLAQISTSTGLATSWDPAPSHAPLTIAASGNDLYVGGQFTSIAGVSQDYIAKFDMSTGNLVSWDPSPSSTVYDIVIYGSDVIVGGQFTSIGGVGGSAGGRLSWIDGTSATAISWSKSMNNTVYDLTMDGDILYIDGAFTSVSNRRRTHLAAFDMSTTTLLDWNPGVNFTFNGNVLDLAAGSGNVYVGGNFVGIGGESRTDLAVLDKSTLTLNSFDVAVEPLSGTGIAAVYSMVLDGNTLYIGGDFHTLGGQTRTNLGSVSLLTEVVSSWVPDASGDVNTLLTDDNDLYVGGAFGFVGGATRGFAAKFNLTTTAIDDWNPQLNNEVKDIAISGSTVYLTGNFTTANGAARSRIVAVEASGAAPTSWDPGLNNAGEAIVISPDGTVYVGGNFTTVGSDARNKLAAIDPTTGLATSWNPNAGGSSGTVYDLAITSHILYVGGDFNFIDGITKRDIAAVDIITGSSTSWDVQLQSGDEVRALAVDESNVYFSGTFDNVLGTAQQNTAAVARNNDAPRDIILDNNSINENSGANALIGNLSVDDDGGDTHTYTLVTGSGDTNNNLFTINGSELIAQVDLDYEVFRTPSLVVRIRATDQNGYYTEEEFTIAINNVIETGNAITNFDIPGQEGDELISTKTNAVTVTMPFGTNVSSLTPSIITVSSGASVSPDEGVTQDFTSPVNYTVTSENGNSRVWAVSVEFGSIPGATYSVKTGGDFETFSDAVIAINTYGIAGNIVLEIGDQSFPATTAFEQYDGMDTYSVTIQPEAGATSPIIFNTLFLNGTKNIIIDGMEKLIFSNGNNSGTVIWVRENATSGDLSENIVIKNAIINTRGTGIRAFSVNDITIENNEFGVSNSTSVTLTAVSIGGGSGVSNVTVKNNFVNFDHNNSAFGSVFGVRASAASGTVSIINNVMALNPDDGSEGYGVQVSGMIDDLIIAHNTISLAMHNAATTVRMKGIELPSAASDPTNSLIIQNNIIELGDGASSSRTGIEYRISDTPVVTVLDNNIDFSSVGIEIYMRVDGTNYEAADLSVINQTYGTTNVNVVFTDEVGLDFTLAGASLNEIDLRGLPVTSVTEDKDENSRSINAPSLGAYEVPNTITEIIGLTFTNQVGDAIINSVNHTVTADLSGSGDLTNVSPTITAFPGASISPSSGVAQDFSSGVNYTVTAEAGNQQMWTVSITQSNVDPTDISLNNTSIQENNSVNDPIGTLSTTDADTGDTFTYSLVAGPGDTDNGSFNILNDQLRATDVFDFETKSSYSVRINTNDGNGGNFAKSFMISINDQVEAIIWDGSVWSNVTGPTASDDAVINGDYSTTVEGNIVALDIVTNPGFFITIGDGTYIEVNGDLTHNGISPEFVVESGGSLVTKGDVTGNFIIRRTTTFDENTGKYSIVGSPVTGATFNNLGSSAIIYGYDETQPYNISGNEGLDRFRTPAELGHGAVFPGFGYFSAKTGDANGQITFVGNPGHGTKNVLLSLTDHPAEEDMFEGFNLVANPYPCAIDYNSFIFGNSGDIESAIYLWDDFDSESSRGTNADYVVINSIGNVDSRKAGLSKWDGHIRSMQGFFVQAKGTGDLQLDFTDAMKVTANNDDAGYYRTTNEQMSFKLILESSEGNYAETLIGMREEASLEKDQFDARLFSPAKTTIYSQIGGEAYAIQGLPRTNTLEIPVGIKTEVQSTYEISIDEPENLEGYNIMLKDHLLNKFIEISSGETHRFSSSEQVSNNRFSVVISNEITSIEEAVKSDLIVFQSESRNLIIRTSSDEVINSVELISLAGQSKLLKVTQLNSNEWQTNQVIKSGLFMIRVSTDKSEPIQKIILR